eukprot:1182859-Prorocentrum_minimum.AAC.9
MKCKILRVIVKGKKRRKKYLVLVYAVADAFALGGVICIYAALLARYSLEGDTGSGVIYGAHYAPCWAAGRTGLPRPT